MPSYLRTLHRLAGGTAVVLALAGAGFAQEYSEAPALAALVGAGSLPSVADRLPGKPPVVDVVSEIGTYGGTWDEYLGGPGEEYKLPISGNYEPLVRWSPDFKDILPNLATSWDVSADGKEFIFHLVEGIKWSDGEPFTADDIVFAVDDVFNNAEIYPGGPPSWLKAGTTPATVEKIDDYTVKFAFAETQGLFLRRLAQASAIALLQFPKHYMQQFTKDAEGIDAKVSEAGLASWTELFLRKSDIGHFGENVELPVLDPWKVTSAFADGGTQLVYERNPYYWKVDSDGHQLPYINKVVYHIIQDVELTTLAMMNRDLDSLMLGDDSSEVLTNKAIFAENADKGDYRIVDLAYPGPFRVVGINMTFPDPAKRAIFANKDFRIGMSHAINRQEVIDLLYFGVGEPFQASPAPQSSYYDQSFSKQYTEFDPAKANEYLDKVLPNKDGEGFRLMPDGSRFTITFDMIARPDDVDLFEILVQHWAKVGIEAHINGVDRTLRNQRMSGNQSEGFTYGGAEGTFADELLDPRWYVPVTGSSFFGIEWANWYLSGGTKGEAPPPDVQAQVDLYKEAVHTADQAKQTELIKQILAIAKEQFYMIGVSTRGGGYVVIGNNLKNVPDQLYNGPSYFRIAPSNPAQFYLADGK